MGDAYLDIETTGLFWPEAEITVVGIYLVHGFEDKLVQLVGEEITVKNLLEALKDTNTIFTYNGKRFDLPFIKVTLGIDLESIAIHHDLMYDCWRCNLYGGLKAVEQQLGIHRRLQGITGLDAVELWKRYIKYGDRKALSMLLEYNQEDVMNLRKLKERLPGPSTLAVVKNGGLPC